MGGGAESPVADYWGERPETPSPLVGTAARTNKRRPPLRQFAEAAGIEPVLCINFSEDMAGLLQYLFDARGSTAWGRQRIADGHPAPYKPFAIVCSNEEPQQACDGRFPCYIANFTRWANETKVAAKAMGVWPLALGVSLASGAHRKFLPGSEDPYAGGSTEMLAAIKAAEVRAACACVWHGLTA